MRFLVKNGNLEFYKIPFFYHLPYYSEEKPTLCRCNEVNLKKNQANSKTISVLSGFGNLHISLAFMISFFTIV